MKHRKFFLNWYNLNCCLKNAKFNQFPWSFVQMFKDVFIFRSISCVSNYYGILCFNFLNDTNVTNSVQSQWKNWGLLFDIEFVDAIQHGRRGERGLKLVTPPHPHKQLNQRRMPNCHHPPRWRSISIRRMVGGATPVHPRPWPRKPFPIHSSCGLLQQDLEQCVQLTCSWPTVL